MPKTTENIKPAKSHLLFDKIVSGQNIYNAIYCMESYVFEKGLLDSHIPVKSIEGDILANNDLELYYALGDKFNLALIDEVIKVCQQRLEKLLTLKDDLFEISVYFKLKGWEDENQTP